MPGSNKVQMAKGAMAKADTSIPPTRSKGQNLGSPLGKAMFGDDVGKIQGGDQMSIKVPVAARSSGNTTSNPANGSFGGSRSANGLTTGGGSSGHVAAHTKRAAATGFGLVPGGVSKAKC